MAAQLQPVTARLACDGCRASLPVPDTAEHPWRVAGREGWRIAPGECLCPQCRPSRGPCPLELLAQRGADWGRG